MKRIILWKKGCIHPMYYVDAENDANVVDVLNDKFPELINRGYNIFINSYASDNCKGEYADRDGEKRCNFCGYIILEGEEECPFCGRQV